MRRSVFVSVILLAAACLRAGELPAPVKTEFTNHDFYKASLEYDQSTMSDAYQRIGQRDPSWDAAALRVLDKLAVRFNNSRVEFPYKTADDTSDEILQRLTGARELRLCRDPMVLYARAILYRDMEMTQPYESTLSELMMPLLASEYAPHLKHFALSKYLKMKSLRIDEKRKEQLTLRLYDEFADYLLLPVGKPIERRLRAKNLFDEFESFKPQYRKQVLDRVEKAGNMDPWLLHMTRGIHEYKLAWDVRGGGFSNTVTEAGWKGFAEHLAKAREEFESAYKIEPAYPESAKSMIQVAMAMGSNDCSMRDWFDRAIAAQIDYMPAWRAYEFGLYPRWHGSPKEMYALGQEALRTGRFDTSLPVFLLDVVDDIRKDRYPGDEGFDLTDGAWNDIKAVYNGYLAKPAPKLQVNYFRTRQLGYAYICQAYEDCLELLKLLGTNVDRNALYHFAPTEQEIRVESVAMLSDKSATMRRARRMELSEKYQPALRSYKRALESMDASHQAWGFAKQHEFFCEALSKLSSGMKVELPMKKPDPLYFWRDAEKAPWRQTDEFLEFSTQMPNWSLLRAGCPVPKNIRVKLEWSYSSAAGQAPTFGVMLSEMSQRDGGYFGVKAVPMENKVHLACSKWHLEESVRRNIDLSPDVWHTWVVERRGRSISVEHDGKPIIVNFTNSWNNYGDPVLVFFSNPKAVAYSIRLRNMVLEQLETKQE